MWPAEQTAASWKFKMATKITKDPLSGEIAVTCFIMTNFY